MEGPDTRARLPGSLVAVLCLDGLLVLLLGSYAGVFAVNWQGLDAFLRLEFAGQVLVLAMLGVAMLGLVRRKGWARLLNAVASCAPVAFFLAVGLAATANLAGLGKEDISAAGGLFYSVLAIITLSPFVVATCALLYAGPGVREWLRIRPRDPHLADAAIEA